MEYKNYWKIGEDSQEELKYTDNIQRIMDEQGKYLFQYTKGMIFSVFSEIKIEDSVTVMTRSLSNLVKGISGIRDIGETIEESTTKDLIDANAMYFDKRYGFEICTEKYRFRLFELRMTPIYPVEIIVDEGICKNIGNTLAKIAIPMEKFNHFKISDDETFAVYYKIFYRIKRYAILLGSCKNVCKIKRKKGIVYRGR